ncbi:MAG: peptidoglycan-binding domain-containing protein [Pseudomonadota bacterium]
MVKAVSRRWRGFTVSLATLATVSACAIPPDPAPEPGVFFPTAKGPEDAPPGTCWGKTVTPAVVERISERIEVTPAEVSSDGTITRLPEYRTEERQVIVTPRRSNWFQTPCAEVYTPEFTASLQRALQARGLYQGPITGTLDAATNAAVGQLQQQDGLKSPVMSLETARRLGLIAVELD